MYDTVGFHQAYLILGCITLSFTLLSFVTLRGGNRLLPTAETQSPPDSSAPSGMTGFTRQSASHRRDSPAHSADKAPGGDKLRQLRRVAGQPDLAVARGLDNQPGQRGQHVAMQAVLRFIDRQKRRRARTEQRDGEAQKRSVPSDISAASSGRRIPSRRIFRAKRECSFSQ